MKFSRNFLQTYLIVGFIFFSLKISSQDQKIADSLAIELKQGTFSGEKKLEILSELAFNETNDLKLSLEYADKLIKESNNQENQNYLSLGYNYKGSAYRLLGDYDKSLVAFLKSAEIEITLRDKSNEAIAYASIADVYSEMGNSKNSEEYYEKAITILRQTDEDLSLATTLFNAGDEAFNTKQFNKALNYYDESGQIFEDLEYPLGLGYTKGNIGMVYAENGINKLAEQNINEAILILEEFGDYSAIAEYLTYMTDIYIDKQDFNQALNYGLRSLKLATENNLQKQISESSLKLSELYEKMGDTARAYPFYKKHIAFRDSIINLDFIQKNADALREFEVSQKQIKVELAENRSRTQLIILGFTGALLITLLIFFKSIKKEKKKSDTLLLNILPQETADELKKKGRVKAKKYESVSVLFTDFKGFTSYSEKLSPEELVKTVGYYFSKFDTIIEKYNLEKIKTIGDAYMCAGGIYHNKDDHAQKLVAAALEISSFVEKTKMNSASNELNFDIRLGINTGPVVAGVVGTKKFAYDIWGDTVNVASRMETNGKIGRVNISEITYNLVKDQFKCKYRGELAVKNRGHLKMYLVEAPKEKLLAKKLIDS